MNTVFTYIYSNISQSWVFWGCFFLMIQRNDDFGAFSMQCAKINDQATSQVFLKVTTLYVCDPEIESN